MSSPECKEKVDPDRIQLPGTRGHSLNTLEEFELDYSQVGREENGREGKGREGSHTHLPHSSM